MERYFRIGGAVCSAALLIGVAACSGRGGGGSSAVPPVGPGAMRNPAPLASATPPVTAPVTIPYPYTNTWTTKTWTGPTAPPSSSPGSDRGVITVKFALDKKTGVYDVLELVKSKLGYVEDLDSAIAFAPYHSRGGIAQIILSDNYTFVEGPFSQTGMDTYPRGENSFDFPLTTGYRWSAAALHTSYYNESLSGKGAFDENVSYTEAPDGAYDAQTSFSNLGGKKIEDNFASTTHVALFQPSVYTLSEPAAGYNKLTQTFELPNGGVIPVRSTGHEPLPFPRGTVDVPDWYPDHGALPSTFYYDRFHVVGAVDMPSSCGAHKGKSSTEVIERYADLDPVQGFYNTYTTWYYLAQLAPGQYWFACIIEKYENETFANGWAMSAGNWGKLSSQQVGTEILIAKGANNATATTAPAFAKLPALTFPLVHVRPHGDR
jgi:hypothetical protein